MNYKNIKELKKNAKYYEDLLGLQNWAISYKLVKQGEFSDNCTSGSVSYFVPSRVANVKILKEEDHYDSNRECNQEEFLVHELLHVKFGIVYDSLKGIALDVLHQNIDDMSRSIVKCGG